MVQRKNEPVPWRCGNFRTAVQRAMGLFLAVAGLAGVWYWQGHPLPVPQEVMRAALIGTGLMVPLGLWQTLDSPRQRPQEQDELAVFFAGWIVPACALLELVLAVLGAGFIPFVVEGAGVGIVLLWNGFLDGGAAAMVLSIVAARNLRLLILPDGSAEYMDILGRVRRCERGEAVCLRTGAFVFMRKICDSRGHTLYRYDGDMVNAAFLEERLRRLGIAPADPAEKGRVWRLRRPAHRILNWDETDRTPAHRWLPWLRYTWLLALGVVAAQLWLYIRGIPVLGTTAVVLLIAWLPVIFCGLYLLFPQIYVWVMPRTDDYPLERNRVLVTKAWRENHVSLLGGWFAATLAFMACDAISGVQAVVDPWRLALLCIALAVVLGGVCGVRMAAQKYRDPSILAIFLLILCFPLGYSLNYALCGPCRTVQAAVVEARASTTKSGDPRYSLTFDLGDGWVEIQVPAETYEYAQTAGAVPLHLRQSPLGIRMAHCPNVE